MAWDSVPLGREFELFLPLSFLFLFFLPPPSPPFQLTQEGRPATTNDVAPTTYAGVPPLAHANRPVAVFLTAPSAKLSRSRFFPSSLTEDNIPSHTQGTPLHPPPTPRGTQAPTATSPAAHSLRAYKPPASVGNN